MLKNSGSFCGREEVTPNMSASINMSQHINANTTPVNMTLPLVNTSINLNPMQTPSHKNNVNSQLVHSINSPLNMSSINICNSTRMNEMAGNYEEIMRQQNQSNISANYNGSHMDTNSTPLYNQAIAPFNYFSNPMDLGYSTIYKDARSPFNVKCEKGVDDIAAVEQVEKTRNKFTDTQSNKLIPTVNEKVAEKTVYENIGYHKSITQIGYNKNPFVNDAQGVTKEQFESKYNMLKFKLVNTESSYDEATKLILEDKSDSQKIFECQHCELLFKNAKRFVIHYKWHSFGKLNDIRKRHFEEAKTRKKITKIESKEVKDNKEDSEEVHNELSCEFCNQIYASKLSLKNHIRRVHSGTSKECSICHKSFHNWSYLKSHMTTHTEERKYMCDECPKTFKFVHSLMRHRPTHLKEKNFNCQTCDKSFGSRLLLKIHSKTHERVVKGAEFRCTYCGKGFYHAYTLAIHERTHTGEKPFKCDICHSAYGTNSSLQRHLKVSHNNESKPFECTICQRAFGTDAMLDRHYLRSHPEPESRSVPCHSCTQMFHSQTQCDAHINKVHLKQGSETQRRRRKKKVPQVMGHTCP